MVAIASRGADTITNLAVPPFRGRSERSPGGYREATPALAQKDLGGRGPA
ncbi:hypothetical protein GCM10010198_21780 [Nocardia seriolae]|nr:hypothetical protein NSER024013_77530 [Nocardia seriolae]GEM28936.1 hypothetical protein NS2_71750 [Nocardia seriolae NBRC 15557]